MKVAITYENGEVFQHFGHTENFKVYTVENGKILSSEIISSNGTGHESLAGMLKGLGIETLICGGIGGGAVMAMNQANIKVYAGNIGNADEAVQKFVSGTLAQNTEATCNHHDHEHGEGHSCGHNCGEH